MRTRNFLGTVPFLALLVVAGCGGAGHEPDPAMAKHMEMMKADSAADAQMAAQEAAVKSIIDVLNSGSMEGLDKVMAADIVDHQQDPTVTTTGLQGAKDMFAMVRTAYPDFKQEILGMSTSGDRTYIHFRMTGTNTGPWGDMPATGKTTDVMGVDIFRFQDGKCAEHWGYMEEMKMMTQLGLMPAPGEEPKKK